MDKLTFPLKTLYAIIAAIFIYGCAETSSSTVLMLEETNLKLELGKTHQLAYEVFSSEGKENISVTFESSDYNVAEVSVDGLINAVSTGHCMIKALTADKQEEAICHVTVVPALATSVTISEEEINMNVGETITLTVNVEPVEAIRSGIIWESSDFYTVQIDSIGNIKALMSGEAIVSACVAGMSASAKITVNGIPASKILIDPEKINLFEGESVTITATVLPFNASDKNITYVSDDESIVTVDSDGNVNAISSGQTFITATAGNITAKCDVTIRQKTVNIGDFFYSDGSYSTDLNTNKECIGIVFYVGDPREHDTWLSSVCPDCMNGLVVSLTEVANIAWCEKDGGSLNTWIDTNTDFPPISSAANSIADDINKIVGYRNTAAIEAYNKANPENIVNAVDAVVNIRSSNPTPEETSGWYLPSPKELSLLCTGIYDNNIAKIASIVTNRNFINSRLEQVEGSTLLSETGDYHTSMENTWNYSYILQFRNGMLSAFSKSRKAGVRAILAF